MTDAAAPTPFTLLGDPNAAACEGEFCAVPGAEAEIADDPGQIQH